MSVPLPESLLVLERGWLSANNILCFDGDAAILVDSGYVTHAAQTVDLVGHALRGRRLKTLINTHSHSDHIGGNAALQAAFGCEVMVPAGLHAAIADWDEDGFTGGKRVQRAGGATVANGLAWSPNGRTMYWTDTKAHTIYAFDFEPATGEIGGQRVFASFPLKQDGQSLDSYGGRPDGAAVDAEGCYWVAMFEGQRLLRLSPTGEVLREVKLPVRCATMPCFGGADLKTIYLTTAREKRPAAELAAQPWAGCVLAFDVDVPGLPVNFAA